MSDPIFLRDRLAFHTNSTSSQTLASPFYLHTEGPMTVFTLDPPSMWKAIIELAASRKITQGAFLDLPLEHVSERTTTGGASVQGQSISAHNGAVATPSVAPCIRWRMLRKHDDSLSLRVDHAFTLGEDHNGQWHSSETFEIPAEDLSDEESSLRSVSRAMKETAMQCMGDHQSSIDRMLTLGDTGVFFEDIQMPEMYHYLSPLSAEYLTNCIEDPDRWLPPADLILVFAESRTVTAVCESLLRHPEALQRVTHTEVSEQAVSPTS